jgi:hypothetical protein
MKRRKWLVLLAVLAMVAVLAAVLTRAKSWHRLSPPGLKLIAQPVFDVETNQIGSNTIALPERVLNYHSSTLPISLTEVRFLPKDTTFARRLYIATNELPLMFSVLLMGTDRGSIHQPEICLVGQGWQIVKRELDAVPMARPYAYHLPVMKLFASKRQKAEDGRAVERRGLYVYWFVADQHLTARHGQRMWWMARRLLLTGTLERWAYVACWAECPPGQEAATFDKIKRFIAAASPEFQLTAGTPLSGPSPP